MSDKKNTEQKDNVTVQTDPAVEVAKILKEAEAKAAQIVAEAEAKAKETEEAARAAAVKEAEAKGDGTELVTIQLFKDSEKYKDDKFVAVNGKTWQIKRGVPVQVPRYVADVLEQSMKQDTATANMIERENAEFERKAEQLGV